MTITALQDALEYIQETKGAVDFCGGSGFADRYYGYSRVEQQLVDCLQAITAAETQTESEERTMIVYRDVVPVVGEAVPEGCEWRLDAKLAWEPETKHTFSQTDLTAYLYYGLRYRYPEAPSEHWLNTLSLD